MKFGLVSANAGPWADPEAALRLARAAEDAGFESLWTIEHVVLPIGYQSEYPYAKDGRLSEELAASMPDPLIPLAAMASVTKRIRLATGILILPQRHPLYTAKEVATLDQYSNGRVILGIGIGWLREEFDALGIPFEERVGRTEEAVKALRTLWSPGAQAFNGKYYRWNAVDSSPKPVQKPGVPIVVGGHVEGAARRAARIGDGFFPAKGDLPALFAAMRDECAKIGRNPAEVELTTFASVKIDEAGLEAMTKLGVSRLAISPYFLDPKEPKRGLEEFAERVIARAG